MKIIIVGGGKLGKDIADNMLERKYDVRLIEKNRAKCIELANDLDVEIICGDGYRIGSSGGSRNKKCRLLYLCYR
ncbi:MAG: NAD-binding protein [Eubacteriales bacterium]